MWKITTVLLLVYVGYSVNQNSKDKFNICIVSKNNYQCIPVLLTSADADKVFELNAQKIAGRSDVKVVKLLVSSSDFVQ
jgi:hypothetical protein